MAQKLSEMMEAERTKLTARRTELATELADIDTELARIDAYFGTKTTAAKSARQPRGKVQDLILKAITANAGGVTRGDLIGILHGVGEQSISNALSALKKGKKITNEGGKYKTA